MMKPSLLSLFDKLITERGSANVLAQHVALLKEQYTILETENVDLHRENDGLKKKIHILEQRLESHANPLSCKYGILWDSAGTPS